MQLAVKLCGELATVYKHKQLNIVAIPFHNIVIKLYFIVNLELLATVNYSTCTIIIMIIFNELLM